MGTSVVGTGSDRTCAPTDPGRAGRRRPVRRWQALVLTGVAALLLAACGGGEQAGQEDPEAGGAELGAGEEADDAAAAPESSPEADAPAEDADEGEGGVREHRPPEDPDTFADCGNIGEDDPGAVIRFPSDGALDAGPGPVTVEVVGCGNTFEANVQWEAYHGDNRTPTLEGHTMGGTMGDWDTFSIVETYWTPGDWTVVVFEIDAESGDRREYDQVTFTVG